MASSSSGSVNPAQRYVGRNDAVPVIPPPVWSDADLQTLMEVTGLEAGGDCTGGHESTIALGGLHAEGGNFVTRAPVLHGVSGLASVERHEQRCHLGGRRTEFTVRGRQDIVLGAASGGSREARSQHALPGGQEHRQLLRRANVGAVDLRQLARHAGLHAVRNEGEGGGHADEDDERAGTRGVLLRLQRLRSGCMAGAWRGWCMGDVFR